MDRSRDSRSREGLPPTEGHKDIPKLLAGLRARDQQLGIVASVQDVA
jgi:hypothetical protein